MLGSLPLKDSKGEIPSQASGLIRGSHITEGKEDARHTRVCNWPLISHPSKSKGNLVAPDFESDCTRVWRNLICMKQVPVRKMEAFACPLFSVVFLANY